MDEGRGRQTARRVGISRVNLSRILNEKAGISAELSIKLSQAFGQPTADIWFKMQNAYDFWQSSQIKRAKVRRLKVAA
ncbi:HigA family addiction module antitoxin [Granulicella arctica]|uniref:Addiction module HigA family antidote n=1 Tax=Granulicella arctica TaxID=940613 RepID=A0A7Y9TEX9_9BACT|nr:HigA family addiction module antitoxin [Granulicella arctica]NYF78161.1 addiction module HigA family antidote [Granulicella arctica]